MEIEAWYMCVYCFEQNEIVVDPSGGMTQEYVEDCQVCCRPNHLRITIHADHRGADVNAEKI